MRKKLLALLAVAALSSMLVVPGQASAAAPGAPTHVSAAATVVKGFLNYAQNQCIGTRWWNSTRYASLYSCNVGDPLAQQRWVFDNATLWNTQIRLYGETRCLTHRTSGAFHLSLDPCNSSAANQRWNHWQYDGTYFMLKNDATGECMEGWWNEWVEMVSCNSLLIRQWWSHKSP